MGRKVSRLSSSQGPGLDTPTLIGLACASVTSIAPRPGSTRYAFCVLDDMSWDPCSAQIMGKP